MIYNLTEAEELKANQKEMADIQGLKDKYKHEVFGTLTHFLEHPVEMPDKNLMDCNKVEMMVKMSMQSTRPHGANRLGQEHRMAELDMTDIQSSTRGETRMNQT